MRIGKKIHLSQNLTRRHHVQTAVSLKLLPGFHWKWQPHLCLFLWFDVHKKHDFLSRPTICPTFCPMPSWDRWIRFDCPMGQFCVLSHGLSHDFSDPGPSFVPWDTWFYGDLAHLLSHGTPSIPVTWPIFCPMGHLISGELAHLLSHGTIYSVTVPCLVLWFVPWHYHWCSYIFNS